MNFAEAIVFSKKFPRCHPKIFKGFHEWGIFDTETDGYVVLIDTELYSNQLEGCLKSRKVRIDRGKDYSMIFNSSSSCTVNDH
jgi:hypothetical protein